MADHSERVPARSAWESGSDRPWSKVSRRLTQLNVNARHGGPPRLRQALDCGQFLQPPGLLDRRPRPSLGARECEDQPRGQIDSACLDADGIPAQALPGGHAPIAVEQDELHAPGEGNGKAGLTLTIALQRLPQPFQGPGVGEPQAGIAQIQAVPVSS